MCHVGSLQEKQQHPYISYHQKGAPCVLRLRAACWDCLTQTKKATPNSPGPGSSTLWSLSRRTCTRGSMILYDFYVTCVPADQKPSATVQHLEKITNTKSKASHPKGSKPVVYHNPPKRFFSSATQGVRLFVGDRSWLAEAKCKAAFGGYIYIYKYTHTYAWLDRPPIACCVCGRTWNNFDSQKPFVSHDPS